MNEFSIESGKAIPADTRNKYPFEQMNIDDSFFVPVASQRPKIVRNAADAYGKHHGKKFRVLTVEGGARCWRVE